MSELTGTDNKVAAHTREDETATVTMPIGTTRLYHITEAFYARLATGKDLSMTGEPLSALIDGLCIDDLLEPNGDQYREWPSIHVHEDGFGGEVLMVFFRAYNRDNRLVGCIAWNPSLSIDERRRILTAA